MKLAGRLDKGKDVIGITYWGNDLFLEIKKRMQIDGLWRTLLYVFRGVCFRIIWCKVFLVLTKDINKISFPDACLKDNIEVLERFDKGKFDRYFGPLTLKKFKDRFNVGAVCFLYYEGGTIAHYSWLKTQGTKFVTTADEEAYLFDSYTFPYFRKQGIHTAMLYKRLRYIKEMGCKRAVICVDILNQKALKILMTIFGFNVKRVVLYIKILGQEYGISKNAPLMFLHPPSSCCHS